MDVREVPNLVGIIAGQEYTLSHRIDMEYNGIQRQTPAGGYADALV